MIPKIILSKGPDATRRTIGYLFGKGRANEHIDPHLVASWNDFAPDPGRSPHRDPKDVEAQLAGPVLTDLARRSPGLQTKRRFAHHLQQAVPEHSERILKDPAWDALATVLAEAEAAGHNAAIVLDQALGQRTLDDAHSPARALTWRIRRLGARHAPGPRAEVARVRNVRQHPALPVQSPPQSARRR